MWHQGRLKLKQNSFNDVYAISEDLIARGITSAAKLGVVGGSNGGTMAATVTVQRPDLFRANIAQSPTTDMLGLIRDPIAKRSDESRVGQECVSTCRYRWSRYHSKKKKSTRHTKKQHK